MRGFALLLTLALPALAAPLAAPEANSNAVALDTRNSVALRSNAAAAVERQLAPGGLGNIDLGAIVTEVTDALHGVVGMTDDILQTVVDIVEGILKGNPLEGDILAKLLSIPKDILTQLPQILSPILTPATAGIPLVNSVVGLLLSLLSILGGTLGAVGGATTGAIQVRAVDLGGLALDDVLGQVGDALKSVEGITDFALETVLGLVQGLLSGNPLDPTVIAKLTVLPAALLTGIVGALTQIVAKLPVLGPILAPLLAILQLVVLLVGGLLGPVLGSVGGLLGGILGPVTGAVGGVVGGATGAVGGAVGSVGL